MFSSQQKQKTNRIKKQSQSTYSKTRSKLSSTNAFGNVSHAAALLCIAGIASTVSQLNLSPVFGSIPASLHHQPALVVTIFIASLTRLWFRYNASYDAAKYVAVVAFWTPVLQCWLFAYSEKLGTEYGPLMVEAVSYFPLLFLSIYSAGDWMASSRVKGSDTPALAVEFAIPTVSYFTVSTVAEFSSRLLPKFIGSSIYATRIGLQLLLAVLSAILTPSAAVLLALPAVLHTLWMNPHLPTKHGFQLANSTLVSGQNFTLLDRRESVTGYLSVLENYADHAYRVLRCDHSLLGGEWLVTPAAYEQGQRKRETVFTVFVMLEAVRLIETEISPEESKSRSKPESDSSKSALVVGLGIGTAPNALIAHGINTTIVELDPAVYDLATRYFDLHSNHTAIIDDAVAYVGEKSVANPASFRYIIHDVFTGGAEPVALFTPDFMRGLFRLLTDDGAVAINYAGDLALDSTNMVLKTIHHVFPKCRVFRETPRRKGYEAGEADFVNLIVFCVKRLSKQQTHAFDFRPAVEEDFLDSLSRRHYLQPKAELEIHFDFAASNEEEEEEEEEEKKNSKSMSVPYTHELAKHHRDSAIGHWSVMRTVLPHGVWNTW